jgi:hypothetical protein
MNFHAIKIKKCYKILISTGVHHAYIGLLAQQQSRQPISRPAAGGLVLTELTIIQEDMGNVVTGLELRHISRTIKK